MLWQMVIRQRVIWSSPEKKVSQSNAIIQRHTGAVGSSSVGQLLTLEAVWIQTFGCKIRHNFSSRNVRLTDTFPAPAVELRKTAHGSSVAMITTLDHYHDHHASRPTPTYETTLGKSRPIVFKTCRATNDGKGTRNEYLNTRHL